MNTEEKIRMATQLYDCRKTFKDFNGPEWKRHLEPFKEIIRRKMKADATDEVTAAIRESAVAEPAVAVICLFAAAVDMVEPE